MWNERFEIPIEEFGNNNFVMREHMRTRNFQKVILSCVFKVRQMYTFLNNCYVILEKFASRDILSHCFSRIRKLYVFNYALSQALLMTFDRR